MNLETYCKFRVLEYVVFFDDVSGFIFVILGFILKVMLGLQGSPSARSTAGRSSTSTASARGAKNGESVATWADFAPKVVILAFACVINICHVHTLNSILIQFTICACEYSWL